MQVAAQPTYNALPAWHYRPGKAADQALPALPAVASIAIISLIDLPGRCVLDLVLSPRLVNTSACTSCMTTDASQLGIPKHNLVRKLPIEFDRRIEQ